jgi:hypothetical protein
MIANDVQELVAHLRCDLRPKAMRDASKLKLILPGSAMAQRG